MKRRIVACALVLVLALGLLTGCGKDEDPVNVQSVAVITGYGSIGTFNTCAGVVTAQNEVTITKEETKVVKDIFVEVGDEIKAGQALFAYDTDSIKLSIEKAQLEIEQLKNSLTTYDDQIKQLQKEKASAPSSEQLSYTVQIQSLQTERKEAEYNITLKQKDLDALVGSSENGEVTSPVDGRVESINENGETDDYGNPKPFMMLVEDGAYKVKGTVNETNIQDLYVDAEVIVRSRIDSEMTWTGHISKIDTEPDNSSNSNTYYYDGGTDDYTSSSKFPFYVELDSTDGLLLGQHVYIEPNFGQDEQADSFQLMADYLVEDGDSFYVWAADKKDKLEKRKVTVGTYDEEMNMYEILDGLTPEDYIAYPEEGLSAGRSVSYQDSFDGMVDDGMIDDGIVDDGMIDDGAYADGGEADIMPAEADTADIPEEGV